MPQFTRTVPKSQQTYGKSAGGRAVSRAKKLQVYREFDEAATPVAGTDRKDDQQKKSKVPSKRTLAATAQESNAILDSSPPPSQPRKKATDISTSSSTIEPDTTITCAKERVRHKDITQKSSAQSPFYDHSEREDNPEKESSDIIVDPFQDESNVLSDSDCDGDYEDHGTGPKYSLPPPPNISSMPSRRLKPMVVIHRRAATTTTVQRKGVLADKTAHSQVVSIGDYDTIVDPRKDQENQILQELRKTSSQLGTQEESKRAKAVSKITRAVKKAAHTVTRTGARRGTAIPAGGGSTFQPLRNGDLMRTVQHINPFLDPAGDEEDVENDIPDESMSFSEMKRDTSPGPTIGIASRRSHRTVSIRKRDVSHMLQHPDDDELGLPKGKYAVEYTSTDEKVMRLSVDRDASGSNTLVNGTDADGDVYDQNDSFRELPSEIPVATSTPRHKRSHSNMSERTVKKLKGSAEKILGRSGISKLGKVGIVTGQRSPRIKGTKRITVKSSADDNNEKERDVLDQAEAPKKEKAKGRKIASRLKATTEAAIASEPRENTKEKRTKRVSTNDSGLLGIVGSK